MEPQDVARRPKLLPEIGTWKYHALLTAVAILILGPLGAIAAAYMNFSLGFFVGGQVLAGILGSAVTYGYGADGKHGANYMQTMAASVASMAGMGVLIQAMVWLDMPLPPAWQLVLFFGCIGMFGVGVGMLYTPLLVDRMKLTFPSGLAVANILRALTDKRLLKRSIGQLGSGTALGIAAAGAVEKVAFIGRWGVSASTIGAGIVVGSRIAVPGLVMGLIGWALTPWLRSIGWLNAESSFRKIGFVIALAMILGAALVDLSIIGWKAMARLRETSSSDDEPSADVVPQRPLALGRLAAWVAFWGAAVAIVGHVVLGQPLGYLAFALALALVFVLINGISTGISDSNPISSAFVISVLLMSLLGLKDPITGIIAASVLLVGCSIGVDMQQDRSTGARLGSNRVIQFRYQTVGVTMGAVLAVVLAQVFMKAYPALRVNSFDNPTAVVGQWQSAMTFKFVGALRDLGHLPAYKIKALLIGLAIGVAIEVIRKLLHRNEGYRRWVAAPGFGFAAGWLIDAVLLSSPYASSFGGFVELEACFWFAVGGVITSVLNTIKERTKRPGASDDGLPEDMSTLSLIGGGLIAGEAIFALAIGVYGLLKLVG
jgi:uncharacterized oligopeptide transporter (OPT) family protein